jgi:glycosyltransferase involved in cell wall biosynthesis
MLQNQLVRKIHDDINLAVSYINQIETIRRQLIDLKDTLKSTNQKEDIISMVEKLESEFLELEKKLVQLKITGKGQDTIRFEKMIVEKLIYLANNVQISDYRPADSYRDVHKVLKTRLNNIGMQLTKLKDENFKITLNKLKEKGIDIIIAN